jgi:ferredoxin--NADP+ reductase
MEGAIPGRITHANESGTLEQFAESKITPESSVVMMCGNPQMLDDVEAILHARGMQRHKKNQPGQIVVERYW